MRSLIFLSAFFLALTTAHAQADTVAPYRKTAFMPSFSIQQPNNASFTKDNLQKNKPVLILYFSPDCGHCQMETEELLTRMKQLNDLQIVMVTSRPFEDMDRFADHYKINRFPSIKIGSDSERVVTWFYDVKFTPFSALYNKQGRLVKVYEKGIDWDELIGLVKE